MTQTTKLLSIGSWLVVALTMGCGSVAKSNNPQAVYGFEVVDVSTYAAAVEHDAAEGVWVVLDALHRMSRADADH